MSLSYAVATKLKEMEDAGLIDDRMIALAKQAWETRKANLASRSSAVVALQTPPAANRPQPSGSQTQSAAISSPSVESRPRRLYRIVESERESGEVFARRFVLELLDDSDVSTERAIRREYMQDLKLDYAETYGTRNLDSVYVDSPCFQ